MTGIHLSPGLANTVTALIEGVKAATPMVLLAGVTPATDLEHAQHINHVELVTATGAGVVNLRGTDTVADDAIGITASAHLPVVIGGRGVDTPEAEAAGLRFAQRIEAPVATSLRGKGLFAGDPFHLGVSGTVSHEVALDAIGKADCLVVFGASLNKYTSGHRGLTRGKRIVQVNPLASEIGRCTPVTVGLVGDPGLTADAMVKWLDEAEIPGSGARSEHLREQLQAWDAQKRQKLMHKTPAGTVDLYEIAFALEEALPKARVFLTDSGRFMFAFWNVLSVPNPHSYVDCNGFSSIGLGLATAIGAARAAGERPTLLVVGDGGFTLSGLSELATAVDEKLDLVIVVPNDNMDPSLSLLPQRDFARIAEAFGARGLTVTSSAELQSAMQAIATRDRKRPMVIDVKVDPASVYGGAPISRP